MPSVLWTGKLSFLSKLLVNFGNAIAWATGYTKNVDAMKKRTEKGYSGALTDDIANYDKLGLKHYSKISEALLYGKSFMGKTVLDVGCGTGVSAFIVLKHGAQKVVCGDISEYMLNKCENKAEELGYNNGQIEYIKLDSDSLPFENDSFDIVISSMLLGLVPNQEKVIKEMVRVLKPEGMINIATHGPGLYQEAIETALWTLPKLPALGYRLEYWPRDERYLEQVFRELKLDYISTRRITWKESFKSGLAAYDFFASTSSAWWYSVYAPDKRKKVIQKVRNAFTKKGVREITSDIVIASGRKA